MFIHLFPIHSTIVIVSKQIKSRRPKLLFVLVGENALITVIIRKKILTIGYSITIRFLRAQEVVFSLFRRDFGSSGDEDFSI